MAQYIVHRVVLTGGPCGGKSTAQATLSSFFENLGWKVLRVPEAATILFGGGIKYQELQDKQVFAFQNNLMKTQVQLENSFFSLAHGYGKNCLVICDRGFMDNKAYIDNATLKSIMELNAWNDVEYRDARYHQVVHLVTAAKGAENFYTTKNNKVRTETAEQARELDDKTLRGWVGHPYIDIVDNSTGFQGKVKRTISAICTRLGIETGDALYYNSTKRKFLVTSYPGPEKFGTFEDVDVVHDYLKEEDGSYYRVSMRGQNGHYSYMHTACTEKYGEQVIVMKQLISKDDYTSLLSYRDKTKATVYKKRRCFFFKGRYYQLDFYQKPYAPRYHQGLTVLEVYTTKKGSDLPLPDFLTIGDEITGDRSYSMWNLSSLSSKVE